MVITFQETYEKPSICSACGGKCCKSYAGASFPDEWQAPNRIAMKSLLKYALSTGKWAVDFWDGDPTENGDRDKSYFIRPAHTNALGRIVDASWGGTCVFLTRQGCSLGTNRPTGCKGLEPRDSGNGCKVQYGSKFDAVISWYPYNDLIDEIIDEL